MILTKSKSFDKSTQVFRVLMMSGVEHSAESEAFLESLRKDIIHIVAQKLTFDLNDSSQIPNLKPELTSIVNQYLQAEGIAIKDEVRLQLIDGLYNRLAGSASQANTVTGPTDEMRTAIASHLAQFLSDEIEGEALAREIARLIDVKCKQEGFELSEQVRAQLITEMCGRMNVPPPPEIAQVTQEAVQEEEPLGMPPLPGDEVDTEPDLSPPIPEDIDPDAPVSPDLSYEAIMQGNEENPLTAPTGPMEKPAPRPLPKLRARGAESGRDGANPAPGAGPAKSIPLKALTHEIKRELLYHLSQTIDTTILGMNDESQARGHIHYLIEEYCREHRLGLTETETERVIDEILRGEGLEFQL
jgi:septum formation topological specificity factor MinE